MRVVVADDQRSVRDGLVALLSSLPDFEVVGTAADGATAIDIVEREHPDAVLMDLRMPGVDGIAATRELNRIHPDVAVVVLTTFADDESVLAALQAGARSYLTKNAGRADLARALHAAAADQVILDRQVHGTLLAAALRREPASEREPRRCRPAGLTEREGEILALIADGLDNRTIARRLFISNATVKSHVNRVFAKIGVTDRPGAIAYAAAFRAEPNPGAGVG